MKIKNLLVGAALLAPLLLVSPPAAASDIVDFDMGFNASVYIVHGIPGQDLGFAENLPIDIAVDGDCVLRNLVFGQIYGPLSFEDSKRKASLT